MQHNLVLPHHSRSLVGGRCVQGAAVCLSAMKNREVGQDLPNSPLINRVRDGLEASRVQNIGGISSRVTGRGNAHQLAVVQVVGRERLAAEQLRSLNDGRRQAHLDVPLNMAVEEEDARIVRLEPEDGVRVCVDRYDIALGRVAYEAITAWIDSTATTWAIHYLELMAVQMEWMDCGVLVVDDDINNITLGYYEWIDGPINDGIGVVGTGGRHTIQGRHFLWDIGLAVEASPEMVSTFRGSLCCKSGCEAYRGIPFWSKQNSKFMVRVLLTGPYAAPPS